MNVKNKNFEDKKIKKSDFYKSKKINKYFIGYNDNDVIRPLSVRLPQMTGYARIFDENAKMSFRVNNKQLLKNDNKI